MKKLLENKVSLQLITNFVTILIVAILVGSKVVIAKPDLNVTNQAVDQGLMSYQGTLLDSTGEPLNGSYDITFRIYTSSTGPSSIWEEVREGTNSVPIQDGLFNVMLGALNPLPASLSEYEELYLGVQIGNDIEMSPRSQIVGNLLSSSNSVSDLPVGTVISWWRQDSNTPLPSDEWMVADGSAVTDPSSPLYGATLPDLRNKFVMGVSVDQLGQTGGNNVLDLSHQHQVNSHSHSIPSHTHSSGSLYSNVSVEDDRVYVKRYGPGFSATNANYTGTSHANTHITDASADVGGSTGSWGGTSSASSPSTSASLSSTTDNRPEYVGLIFLIKIK